MAARKRVRSNPFTLRKLTIELAERGVKTAARAVWTFVHAEGLNFGIFSGEVTMLSVADFGSGGNSSAGDDVPETVGTGGLFIPAEGAVRPGN